MASMATAADMIARYDSRILGDLVSSNKVAVPEDELVDNEVLATALSSATGTVIAAVLKAERYTVEELELLTDDALDYLKDIICQVAIWRLYSRKPYSNDKFREDCQKGYHDILSELRKGAIVFDVARAQDAGTPKIDRITRLEVVNQYQLFVDQARGRFYPRRRSYNNQ